MRYDSMGWPIFDGLPPDPYEEKRDPGMPEFNGGPAQLPEWERNEKPEYISQVNSNE